MVPLSEHTAGSHQEHFHSGPDCRGKASDELFKGTPGDSAACHISPHLQLLHHSSRISYILSYEVSLFWKDTLSLQSTTLTLAPLEWFFIQQQKQLSKDKNISNLLLYCLHCLQEKLQIHEQGLVVLHGVAKGMRKCGQICKTG